MEKLKTPENRQAALFNGQLGWHNNPVEHQQVANAVIQIAVPQIEAGWVAPGGQYRLRDPVEMGWEPVQEAEVIELYPEAKIIEFPKKKLEQSAVGNLS